MMQQPAYSPVSVIIAGAGPTGLAAANLLGQAGIDTLVVERNAGLSNIPKAITLDDEGLRICQAMGLGSAVSKCILSDINAHYLSAGRLLAKVAPTSKKNGYALISTFHQPDFEAMLLQGLQRFACVTIHFQHTVETLEQTSDAVVVSIRTPTDIVQQIKCSYLLACDGGRSTIRRALHIPLQGTSFAQKWLVVDCIADEEAFPSPPIIKFFCNPHRPAVTVPSPNNGRRWEFMLLPGETEKDLLQTAKLAALIQQADGNLLSPSSQIVRQAIYTFHSTLAKTFSQGRVFLLGDAAHMMPPFGGQGMNSGLRDAHNLCWKLAMVLQGLATSRILETYFQERYRHAAQMIRFSSLLGNIVMSTQKSISMGRDMLFYFLNAMPPMREFLTEARLKPQPRYKKGVILTNGSREEKKLVGLMLPQPAVTTIHGQRVLLDDILGPGFALLRRHHNPQEAFATLKTDFWQRLGTQLVCVTASPALEVALAYGAQQTNHSLPIAVVSSEDPSFLHTKENLFIVVRPDRYIFGVFKEEKADSFVSTFQRQLR
ncbi:MAG: bifunctional 3-(3-hydroxy-phenyl)propionate/3-hydroxycinnamic acid hydroxylase [Ktedonobacteraceae bacterium]